MKVTDRIADLVIELGRHEPYEMVEALITGDEISLVNVLRLYHRASGNESRALLTEILSDVGYDWYEHDDELAAASGARSNSVLLTSQLMTRSEFMSLRVDSTYLH